MAHAARVRSGVGSTIFSELADHPLGCWKDCSRPIPKNRRPDPAFNPLTAELLLEQQAVNLLNMWFAKPLSKAEILERIRSDQTISEPVRKQALVLAERDRKT